MRNASKRWSWGLLPVVCFGFVLGCGGQEGIAQEEPTETPAPPAPEEKPASAPAAADAPAKKKKDGEADTNRYWAKILDKTKGAKPFSVRNAVLFVPEVSLFGGGAGSEVKTLELKLGSAVIKVPFSRIKRLKVGTHDEDRLPLLVTLRDVESEDAELRGTVKASLELRGTLGDKNLDTVVKLREASIIDLAVEPDK